MARPIPKMTGYPNLIHSNRLVDSNDNLFLTPRRLHDAVNITVFPKEPYIPPPYQPTDAIVRTHLLPRLGFPKNIGVIWNGNQDQIQTYIIGIVINSCIIIGVMAVALLIMAILRCCGYKRVGFLVGYFEYDVDREDENEDSRVEKEGDVDESDGSIHDGSINRNSSGSVKNEPNENGTKDDVTDNRSTGIKATTIGSGDFVQKSTHVSIVIQKDERERALASESADVNSTKGLKDDVEVLTKPANEKLVEGITCLGTCGGFGKATSSNSNFENDNSNEDGLRNGNCPDAIDEEAQHAQSTGLDPTHMNSIEGGLECEADHMTTETTRPKPKLKRIRTQVALVDRNGKTIRLRPKPVPEVLFLKVRIVRTTFIAFGVGAMMATGLFYSLGVKNFELSMRNLRSSINVSGILLCRAYPPV